MKHNAVIIEEIGDKARVSVLREEACSHCAGRVVCGTAKRFDITVKNPIGAKVGDTVVIENASESILAYCALVFLAPIALAVTLYLVFAQINAVLSFVMPAIGFVLPFAAAYVIDKHRREQRLPVITEILSPVDSTPSCPNAVKGE